MPELGTSGSVGGPGWATAQVYPPALDLGCATPTPPPVLALRADIEA